ncbi:site-specific integrase [Ramlibacter sp. WS9]|uniref:tyrosine-type recombinase/integrase n=1 Tax=Ramlibacter sp. WS9 TaxID=1882741 RepID=UPI001143837F|nr:site-specific integrase [Ramlibacter sp. WS9]ROZ72080.1 site-specific integrase [Ramlibacter sp. WS9]
MARIAKQLSAAEVARLKMRDDRRLHAVGGTPGLCLQLMPDRSPSWVLRCTVDARRHEMGLGKYPEVTLAQARQKGREARDLVALGIDPILDRREARGANLGAQAKARADQLAAEAKAAEAAAEAKAKLVTFKEAAERLMKVKSPEWRSAKHAAQWRATLETYAYPKIGHMPVNEVKKSHLLEVLEPLWHTRTETAERLRQRISVVLDWATSSELRSGPNPARWKGNLDTELRNPKKLKPVKHLRALPVAAMPSFMKDLRGQAGMGALALQVLVLTAARSGEVRGATWDEIDLDSAVWTVPAGRMKGGKLHRVPLSDAAVLLLRGVPRIEDCNLVFPSNKLGQVSDMTLLAVLKRMKVKATVHGFRSAFRVWVGENTAFPSELAEQALAHALGGVEAAYMRSDLLEKRRQLMEAWAQFLAGPKVMEIEPT